jgi:hypothetical protein
MVILYFLGEEDIAKRDSRDQEIQEIIKKAFMDADGLRRFLLFLAQQNQ